MLWQLHHTAGFPKYERFRLAKRIDDALFDFHLALTEAANHLDVEEHLRIADAKIRLLRTYFRLALELKYTTPDQFQYVAERLDEIGRLLGGWIKKA